MAPTPQDDLGKEGNPAQGNSATIPHSQDSQEELSANIGSATPSLSTSNKGRKRRRASSGATQSNAPNARGPRVAKVASRVKGKQAQQAQKTDSTREEMSEKASQESGDLEEEPRMFAGFPVRRSADHTKCPRLRKLYNPSRTPPI
jgi:hypothetical protein